MLLLLLLPFLLLLLAATAAETFRSTHRDTSPVLFLRLLLLLLRDRPVASRLPPLEQRGHGGMRRGPDPGTGVQESRGRECPPVGVGRPRRRKRSRFFFSVPFPSAPPLPPGRRRRSRQQRRPVRGHGARVCSCQGGEAAERRGAGSLGGGGGGGGGGRRGGAASPTPSAALAVAGLAVRCR